MNFAGSWLLQDAPTKDAPQSGRDSGSELDTGARGLIICRACGARVTDSSAVFSPGGGASRRLFANLAGRVFEVLTVTRAAGRVSGDPTAEFTWFPGFLWSYFSCASCGRHLGWRFDAASDASPPAFYALITREISEQDGL